MRKIIVRADDLGYSEGVNYGIAKSCIDGIVRSVGVMTNMPTVEHGLNLLKGHKICLGLHTNICIGKPLSNPKLIPSLLQETGEFKSSKEYRNMKDDFVVLDEVIIEIEAQYQKFVELIGHKPRYFEGHAVSSSNFFKGLEIVAERHGCEYLAGAPADGPVRFKNSMLYFAMDSMKSDYEPFESLKDAVNRVHKDDGIEMFIGHPGYLDSYILSNSSLTIPRAYEVEMLCSEETKEWLRNNEVIIMSYDDLP